MLSLGNAGNTGVRSSDDCWWSKEGMTKAVGEKENKGLFFET